MFKFDKDLRVAHRRGHKTGVIVEYDSTYEVRVLWDGEDEPSYEETESLTPELQADKDRQAVHVAEIQAKVKAASASIEEAFKNWSEAIALANGWDEPLDGSREGAWKLRSIEGLDLSDFENTLEDYGWSTSSLYC